MLITINDKPIELFFEHDCEDDGVDVMARAIDFSGRKYHLIHIKPNGAVKTIGNVGDELGMVLDPGGHLKIDSR